MSGNVAHVTLPVRQKTAAFPFHLDVFYLLLNAKTERLLFSYISSNFRRKSLVKSIRLNELIFYIKYVINFLPKETNFFTACLPKALFRQFSLKLAPFSPCL